MDEPRQGTVAYPVSVGATTTVTGDFHSVHDLEVAIREATRAAGRQLYARAFAALQDGWPAAHRHRFTAQRRRPRHWLTPFGPVELPLRLVREKASGRYLTRSQVFLRHKATRRLSPALEQEACAAATEQNYRPAARALARGIGARLGPWLVWACVQFHGARRLLEQEKAAPPPARPGNVPALISEVDSTWLKAPPPPAQPVNVPALLREVDSTWLKAQPRRRQGTVRHFQVHLGLHYTGRARRYQARGLTRLRLTDKQLLVSTAPPWPSSARPSNAWPSAPSARTSTSCSATAMKAWNGCAKPTSPTAPGCWSAGTSAERSAPSPGRTSPSSAAS